MVVSHSARAGACFADTEQLLSRSWKFGAGNLGLKAGVPPSHGKERKLGGRKSLLSRATSQALPCSTLHNPALHISLPAAGRARVAAGGNPLIGAPYKTGDNVGSFLGGALLPSPEDAVSMGSPRAAPVIRGCKRSTLRISLVLATLDAKQAHLPHTGLQRAGANTSERWLCARPGWKDFFLESSWKDIYPLPVVLTAPKAHC